MELRWSCYLQLQGFWHLPLKYLPLAQVGQSGCGASFLEILKSRLDMVLGNLL